MWRSKKFIVAVLAAAVLLVGGIAGVALAQTGDANNSSEKTLLGRVASILGIDQQKLEDAFTQARTEMQDEALQKLVDEGKITQQQADQYKQWLQSRPNMDQYRQQLEEWQQSRPSVPPEFKEWQQARPDMPLPGRFGGGHRFWGR